MSCKCDEMGLLKNQMDKLTPILDKSERFSQYNDQAIERLKKAKTDAYTATKSTSVQTDVSSMPEMTDVIEDAHTAVVSAIEAALEAMKEKYQEYENEDKVAHEQ